MLFFVLSGLLNAADTSGTNEVWTGSGGDSNWNTNANWSDGSFPDSGDNVTFPDVTNQTVTMNVTATIGTITFNAPDSYTINGSSTLTLGGTVTQNGAGTVTMSAPVATGNAARSLSGSGTGQVTISGSVSGSGLLTVTSGDYRLTNAANSFTGGTSVTGGTLTAESTGAELDVRTGINSQLGNNTTATIDGGTLTLKGASGVQTSSVYTSIRNVTFGTNGGTLAIPSPLDLNGNSDSVMNVTNNANAATPATFTYGTISNATNGWDWSGRALWYKNDNTGTGALSFVLTNGALLMYEIYSVGQTSMTGVIGGAYPSSSTATTTGRVSFNGAGSYPSSRTWTASGTGFTFNGTLQVYCDKGVQTFGSNVTIASGIVGFQGGHNATTDDCIFGTAIGSHTLSIANGATAIMDVRIIPSTDFITSGGIQLKNNVALSGGGTLSFRQTSSGGTNADISVTGDIYGSGSTVSEAIVDIQLASGTGAGQLGWGTPGASGCDLIVNGSGFGGMMIQGSNTRLSGQLTAARLAAVTGSGGYLTIAPSDATFTLPASSLWSDADVGLKSVNSYSGGTDLALGNCGTWSRPLYIDSNATVDIGNSTAAATLTGGSAGAGTIVKSGTQATTINTSAFAHTGGTQISSGSLWVNADLSGTGTVSVSGTATLGGTSSIGGTISTGNGTTVSPGASSGAIGTLALANSTPWTPTSTTTLAIDISGGSADQINCTAGSGTLSLGNIALTISSSSPTAPSFTLIRYPSGTISGTFASVTGLPSGYSLIYGANHIVIANSTVINDTWSGSGSDGNWNTAANWNSASVPAVHANLTFPDVTNQTVTMNVPALVGTMTFNAADSYSISGSSVLSVNGSLSQNGSGTIDISSPVTLTSDQNTICTGTGMMTISGVISGPFNWTKSGTGTLRFGGANTYTGTTTVSQGTLALAGNAPSGSAGSLGNATSAIILGDGSTAANPVTLRNDGTITVARDIIVANQGTGTTITSSLGGGTYSGSITLNKTVTLHASPILTTDTCDDLTLLSSSTGIQIDNTNVAYFAGDSGRMVRTDTTTRYPTWQQNDLRSLTARVFLNQSFTNSITASVSPDGSSWNNVTLTQTGAGSISGWNAYDCSALTLPAGTNYFRFAMSGTDVHWTPQIGYVSFSCGTGHQTFSGVLTGSGGVNVTGASIGTVFLTNSGNNYTGATTVSSGCLRINGAISSTAGVSVSNGATLGGSGTVSGTVTLASGSTLSPGSALSTIGTLTLTGNSPLSSSGAYLDADISGSSCDLVLCSGTGTIDLSGLTLRVNALAVPYGSLTFMSFPSGTFTGSFASTSGIPTEYQVVVSATTVRLEPTSRFWVNGNGTWTDTANWAYTSGGTSGAAVPTSAEIVRFDGNSGGGSASIATAASAYSLHLDSGYTGTLTINSGSSLTLSGTGTTLTTAQGSTLINAGTLSISGTDTSIAGTFTTSSSGNIVRFTGQSDNSTVNIPFLQYHHLEVSRSGTMFRHANGIYREQYNDINGISITDLTGNASYPGSPSLVMMLPQYYEIPVDQRDAYGTRLRALITVPTTGNYTFWISGDDESQLWIATDGNPSNATQVASVPGWTNTREWSKYPAQQSSPIALTAGQVIFSMALQKEQGGGDNLAVGWTGPSGLDERPLPASRCIPYSGGPLMIAGNLTITAGTLDSSRHDLSVAGNWSNSGSFTAGSKTVTLAGAGGSTQVVSGNTTFNHLTATCTTARTLQFTAGSTQTINGTLTLTGSSGQKLILRSTTNASTWSLTPNGSRSCSYVDVRDGINTIAPVINPANSTDSGNTTLWFPTVPPGTPTLLTPVNCPDAGTAGPADDVIATYGRTLNPRPKLIFTVPSDADSATLHFQVRLDGVDGSTLVADSAVSTTGFEWYNGTTWVAFPSGGATTATGNVRYKPQADLTRDAAAFWTVRAYDGTSYGTAATVQRFLVATPTWLAGLTAGSPIRIGHMGELRTEANYLRNFRTLADVSWTDDPLVAWQTLIRKTHVDELRSTLTAIQVITGESVTIGADALTAGQTPIKASHLGELRTALEGL